MKPRVFLEASAILRPGETPDVSFVPPLQRRRLSLLQKIYFDLAHRVQAESVSTAVFASCEGEDSLSHRLVDEFKTDGTVSPHRFSSSVYNAAPGLYSVLTKNTAPYTAIAAGDDTIECGLLESLACPGDALFVTAEEGSGGFGAAIRWSDASVGACIAVSRGTASTDRPMTFESLCRFLDSELNELSGRWLRLTRVLP